MTTGLVLIADGDASTVEGMRLQLEGAGHDVVSVGDGVAAIAELHGAALASCARPLLAKPLDVVALKAALRSCAGAA